ncbi:MAG: ribonuclease R, partial [Desulfobulbus sp.]
MISPGSIIEFIDGGKFVCGFVTGVAEKKVQLVSQNGREMYLAASRILSVSRQPIPQPASREALTGLLQQCGAKRAALAETIDLAELWEIINQDADQELPPDLLADLLFGSISSDDQRAAFLRAVFADPLFFKFKNGLIATHSPEQVEQ